MSYAKGFNTMEGEMLPQRQIFNPTKVTVLESNVHKGKAVAFVGNQLCFFERHLKQPQIGSVVEVMITRPVWADTKPTSPKKIKGVLLRVVDRTVHQPVLIDQFDPATNVCYGGTWFHFLDVDADGNNYIEVDMEVSSGEIDQFQFDQFHSGNTGAKVSTQLWGWADTNDTGENAELLGLASFDGASWENLVKR